MALSGSYTYDKYGVVSCPISIPSPSGYGSTELAVTVDVGANHGKLTTDGTLDTMGSFIPTTGRFKVVGTATEINAALATLDYFADTAGYFSNIAAPVSLQYHSNGSYISNATLTLVANAPAYAWLDAPDSDDKNVQFWHNTNASVSIDLGGGLVTSSPLTLLSISPKANSTIGTGTGFMANAQTERYNSEKVGTGYTLFAPTDVIEAVLSDLLYIPEDGVWSQEFYANISCGVDGAPVLSETFRVYSYGSITGSLDQSKSTLEDVGFYLDPVTITGPFAFPTNTVVYQANLTLSESNAATMSADGATFNANTGVLSVFGTANAVNAAIANVFVNPTPNRDQDFTISYDVSSNIGMLFTGTVSVDVIAINDAPFWNQDQNVRLYTEDVPYNWSAQPIIINEVENDPVSMTLSMVEVLNMNAVVLNAGVLSSNVGGGFNANTATFTIGSNSVSAINSVLATLVYTPAAEYSSVFGLKLHLSDGEDAREGLIYMIGNAVDDPTVIMSYPVAGVTNYTYDANASVSNSSANRFPMTAIDVDDSNWPTYRLRYQWDSFSRMFMRLNNTVTHGMTWDGTGYTKDANLSVVANTLQQFAFEPMYTSSLTVTNGVQTHTTYTEDVPLSLRPLRLNFPKKYDTVTAPPASVTISVANVGSGSSNATGTYTVSLSPKGAFTLDNANSFARVEFSGGYVSINGPAGNATVANGSYVQGTLSDVNNAISQLQFVPVANSIAPASITVSGYARDVDLNTFNIPASQIISIGNGTPVNDPYTLTWRNQAGALIANSTYVIYGPTSAATNTSLRIETVDPITTYENVSVQISVVNAAGMVGSAGTLNNSSVYVLNANSSLSAISNTLATVQYRMPIPLPSNGWALSNGYVVPGATGPAATGNTTLVANSTASLFPIDANKVTQVTFATGLENQSPVTLVGRVTDNVNALTQYANATIYDVHANSANMAYDVVMTLYQRVGTFDPITPDPYTNVSVNPNTNPNPSTEVILTSNSISSLNNTLSNMTMTVAASPFVDTQPDSPSFIFAFRVYSPLGLILNTSQRYRVDVS
ncbi:hypothetical protein [Phenylobacterium sp. SCN 70-31]|uniref:hypothetical protein n=1 Tax=Phenylobacterium sp. SCN 70-31 TaxID=1660129 RepID=UPI000ABC536A|nr:hypothetical protein [Phenylobacterium sp. SCN 70-31]